MRGSDGYVHSPDGGGGLMGVDICKPYPLPCLKSVQLIVCQLHINKTLKNKIKLN